MAHVRFNAVFFLNMTSFVGQKNNPSTHQLTCLPHHSLYPRMHKSHASIRITLVAPDPRHQLVTPDLSLSLVR